MKAWAHPAYLNFGWGCYKQQRDLTDRGQLASHGSSKRNRCAQDFDLGDGESFELVEDLSEGPTHLTPPKTATRLV
ncbi:hypothetical protein NQZ68_005589 [Dissostichus eleginoides]|nr:hypothetical protein NQZ68_005589 [Dissostichus eleginoides]